MTRAEGEKACQPTMLEPCASGLEAKYETVTILLAGSGQTRSSDAEGGVVLSRV